MEKRFREEEKEMKRKRERHIKIMKKETSSLRGTGCLLKMSRKNIIITVF